MREYLTLKQKVDLARIMGINPNDFTWGKYRILWRYSSPDIVGIWQAITDHDYLHSEWILPEHKEKCLYAFLSKINIGRYRSVR